MPAPKKVAKDHAIVKHGFEFKTNSDTKVVISEKEVRLLASLMCPQNDMAKFYDIPASTFLKRFKRVIESEKEKTKQRLRAKQLEEAFNGNTTLLIWLGKNMLGQSDQGPKSEDANMPLPWDDE